MVRYKLPFEYYELAALEDWLNNCGKSGLKLVGIEAPTAAFKQTKDKSLRYRVRWISKDEGKLQGAIYWSNLEVCCSDDFDVFTEREDCECVRAARDITTTDKNSIFSVFAIIGCIIALFFYPQYQDWIVYIGIFLLMNVVSQAYVLRRRIKFLKLTDEERATRRPDRFKNLTHPKLMFALVCLIIYTVISVYM